MKPAAPVKPVRLAPPLAPEPPPRRGRRRTSRRLFPGDRRVWQAAAVVTLVLAVVGTVELLRPRDAYTGTNSVGARSLVAGVPAGQRLCVPDLRVPGGTARIELAVGPEAQPALDATLYAGGRALRTSSPAPPAGASKVSVPLPPGAPGQPLAGKLCVTPRGGSATFGGMAGLQGDQGAPTVAGVPIDARVAVWFRPEAGERTTLLASLPEIARRAALFRAGWVGPWTYWLLLGLLAPALGYASVRLLARATAGESPRLTPALAVGLIALANGAAFATLTPSFDTPDEPDHAAYVQFLAETGHRPTTAPGRGAYSIEQAIALDGVRAYSHVELADARPPWLEADVRRWERRALRFEPFARDEGGGATTPATHRPGYYLLAAPAYLAARGDGFFASLWAMRLVSALLGAITAACTVLFLRSLLPRAPLALAVAGGLLVAFLPQFGFMSGGVNNDAGVTALAAVTLWLAARALPRGLDWRAALPLGLAAGLLPLFKATGIALYPALAIAVAVVLVRRRDRTALAGLAALAVGLAAARGAILGIDRLVTPVAVQGQAEGGLIGAQGVFSTVLDSPTLVLSYLWQTFLPPLPFMTDFFLDYDWPAYDTYIEEGFASFGWYAMEFGPWVYRAVAAAVVAVLAAAAVALWQRRGGAREGWPRLLFVLLVIAGVVGGVTAAYVSASPRAGELPEQGRYAFTALPAFAAVAAFACLALPRRWLGWAAGGLVTAMVALEWASQFMLLQRFYT